MAQRLAGRYGYPKDEPFRPGTLHADKLDQPLKWRKPRRVFVSSMGDPFHREVKPENIAAVFGVMAAARQHTFMVLTKRPKRMRAWFEWAENTTLSLDEPWKALRRATCWDMHDHFTTEQRRLLHELPAVWPLPNVWLGVTAEDQLRADQRIPELLLTPAAVRFVSCEPLLGPINLRSTGETSCPDCRNVIARQAHGDDADRLDWVICGAETGPGARPMDLAWARSLRDQCQVAGVPFFFKKASPGQETPPDLAIRELPEVRRD